MTKSENQNKKNDSTSYYIAIGVIFAYMNGVPMLAKIIALVVPALLSGVAITVLIQRIKEIKKGEDDDLSKY